jgi:hypothetical protein
MSKYDHVARALVMAGIIVPMTTIGQPSGAGSSMTYMPVMTTPIVRAPSPIITAPTPRATTTPAPQGPSTYVTTPAPREPSAYVTTPAPREPSAYVTTPAPREPSAHITTPVPREPSQRYSASGNVPPTRPTRGPVAAAAAPPPPPSGGRDERSASEKAHTVYLSSQAKKDPAPTAAHPAAKDLIPLNKRDIKDIQRSGDPIHDTLKKSTGSRGVDILRDRNGDLYTARTDRQGKAEPTGYNINEFRDEYRQKIEDAKQQTQDRIDAMQRRSNR